MSFIIDESVLQNARNQGPVLITKDKPPYLKELIDWCIHPLKPKWPYAYTKDEYYVMNTCYQKTLADEKAYQDSHPKLLIAGGTGGGSITTTATSTAAEEAIDQYGAVLVNDAAEQAALAGEALGGIELAGLNISRPPSINTPDPELGRRQRALASIHDSMTNNQNVALAIQRQAGNLGPTMRRLISQGSTGITGLVRRINGSRRSLAQSVIDDDAEFGLEEGDWKQVSRELDRMQEIELSEVNNVIRESNRINDDECPELELDLSDNDSDLIDEIDWDTFDVGRDLEEISRPQRPPTLPANTSFQSLKRGLLALALAGGSVGAAAAALTEQLEKPFDVGVPTRSIEDQCKLEIRALWPRADYWPIDLGSDVTDWLNPALDLLDAVSLGQLREMLINHQDYYLTQGDVDGLETAALGPLPAAKGPFTLADGSVSRSKRVSNLADSVKLDGLIQGVFMRGLSGKAAIEKNAQVMFEHVIQNDIWLEYQKIEPGDLFVKVVKPSALLSMIGKDYDPTVVDLETLLNFITLYNQGKFDSLEPGEWGQISDLVRSHQYFELYSLIGEYASPFAGRITKHPRQTTDVETQFGIEIENTATTINGKVPYSSLQNTINDSYWEGYVKRKGHPKLVQDVMYLAQRAMNMWYSSNGIEEIIEGDAEDAFNGPENISTTTSTVGEKQDVVVNSILTHLDISGGRLKPKGDSSNRGVSLGDVIVEDSVGYHNPETTEKVTIFDDKTGKTFVGFTSDGLHGKTVYAELDGGQWTSYAVHNPASGSWDYLKGKLISGGKHVLWLGESAKQAIITVGQGIGGAAVAVSVFEFMQDTVQPFLPAQWGTKMLSGTASAALAVKGSLVGASQFVTGLHPVVGAVLTLGAAALTVRLTMYDSNEEFVKDLKAGGEYIVKTTKEIVKAASAGVGIGLGIIGIGYILSTTGLPSSGFGVPKRTKKKRKRII